MNGISKAIETLNETQMVFEQSICEAELGDRDAIESLDSNNAVVMAISKAIEALREKAERENPQPLSLEEYQDECAKAHYGGKARWLWCVMGADAGWKNVRALAKWGNLAQYGKAWVTYRYPPQEAAE